MLNAHRAIPTKAKHHGIDGKPKSGSIKKWGNACYATLDKSKAIEILPWMKEGKR
jgi:hypothetical protein